MLAGLGGVNLQGNIASLQPQSLQQQFGGSFNFSQGQQSSFIAQVQETTPSQQLQQQLQQPPNNLQQLHESEFQQTSATLQLQQSSDPQLQQTAATLQQQIQQLQQFQPQQSNVNGQHQSQPNLSGLQLQLQHGTFGLQQLQQGTAGFQQSQEGASGIQQLQGSSGMQHQLQQGTSGLQQLQHNQRSLQQLQQNQPRLPQPQQPTAGLQLQPLQQQANLQQLQAAAGLLQPSTGIQLQHVLQGLQPDNSFLTNLLMAQMQSGMLPTNALGAAGVLQQAGALTMRSDPNSGEAAQFAGMPALSALHGQASVQQAQLLLSGMNNNLAQDQTMSTLARHPQQHPKRAPQSHHVDNTSTRAVRLYIASDDDCISPYQCFARQQIELFEAQEVDVQTGAQGRNKPVQLGQVGIRCIHCADLHPKLRARAGVYYPSRLSVSLRSSIPPQCLNPALADNLVPSTIFRSSIRPHRTLYVKCLQSLDVINQPSFGDYTLLTLFSTLF
jgi:hypothetical protein